VTRQTALLLRGVALLWAAPLLVFAAGSAATASAPGGGSAGAAAMAAPPSACSPRSAARSPLIEGKRGSFAERSREGDSFAEQKLEMRCLVERARAAHGLSDFAADPGLDRAAAHKSADILRCDEFSHEACGRDFAYWIERFGQTGAGCSGVAENIAWGTGNLGTPRAIFRAWMRSPGHRRNILGPYAQIGIGLRVGTLEGNPGARVWTEEFAAQGC
jgi:uncharacterized protein YkwD